MPVDIYPFFSFSFEYKKPDRKNINVLFIFKPVGEFELPKFTDYLAKELLNLPVVEQIVFAFPCIDESALNLIKEDEVVINTLLRRGNAVVQGVTYNNRGDIQHFDWFQGKGVEVPVGNIFKEGMSIIERRSPCIRQAAPPNCIFSKPSGEKHLFFIRGSQLLGSDTQISFLSFLLLPFFDENTHELIYIDSMSISPLVYKIIMMKNFLSESDRWLPQVLSFHSYDGLSNPNNRPVKPNSTIILISASSSGSMANKVMMDWRVPSCNVVTLLSYEDAPNNSILMHKLNTPNAKNLKGLTPIKIKGEFFIPVYKKTRSFLIKHLHVPKQLKALMLALYDQEMLCTNKECRSLWVKAKDILTNSEFNDWFNNQLSRRAPLKVSHVIFDTKDSEGLADRTVSFYKGKGIEVKKVHAESILKETDDFDSVIVVAAVVKSGGRLLGISRDLRNKVEGDDKSISYFVGLHLPDSQVKGEVFRSSLTYSSARNFKHNFDVWFEIAVPASEVNPWQEELDLLQRDEFETFEEVGNRVELLRSNEGLTNECFWGALSNKPLSIQKDFVFWDKSFEHKKATNNANVFFTISCILQNARELKESESLRASEYESVCLSPECFFRFNEGVIQASLLRAATKTELNYSLDEKLSALMTDMIIKMINNQENTMADALPEFILALATGKLCLSEPDMTRINDEALSLPSFLQRILEVGTND